MMYVPFSDLPLIDIGSGYWQRAGRLRARVLAQRRKARLGGALIAQSCIDGDVCLITRDRDFRAFVEGAGLKTHIWLRGFCFPTREIADLRENSQNSSLLHVP